MKLYLASLLQKENFGPGRIIGIINTNGGKPRDVKLDSVFEPFTPNIDSIAKYNKSRPTDASTAGQVFVFEYNQQLQKFLDILRASAVADNREISELLPFQDGDTLASWERAEFTNYRKVLAPFLEQMGFEVILK